LRGQIDINIIDCSSALKVIEANAMIFPQLLCVTHYLHIDISISMKRRKTVNIVYLPFFHRSHETFFSLRVILFHVYIHLRSDSSLMERDAKDLIFFYVELVRSFSFLSIVAYRQYNVIHS